VDNESGGRKVMATILSFETQCHLEAIERDLLDMLRVFTSLRNRESILAMEFIDALGALKGEVFMQNLANELDDEIQKAISIDLIEAVIGKEQMMLEDLR
jgi:hypothetical protein